MNAVVQQLRPAAPPAPVICECGFKIFDGEVIRSRVVHLVKGEAKCRCKRWVSVPANLSST